MLLLASKDRVWALQAEVSSFSAEVIPGSSAEVRAAVPSWRIAGMAHYNFKKITVVPSAKVGGPKGPSAPAFLGQVAGRWGSGL